MKTLKYAVFLTATVAQALSASVPLPLVPDWKAGFGDYSTGGACAFIDADCYVDFCTSNGNDMAQNRNAVYSNHGGSLDTTASWRSIDQGYFGHCYAGDVDNDGFTDLAVSYLGAGTAGDLLARVYHNAGNGLETAPYWKAKDRHSSFDCCLGDFDLDGDLDLAISAGDAYSSVGYDRACVYRNNGGTFDSTPSWSAEDSIPSDAVRFCDIDNDGDLELFVGHRGRIVMYRNESGVLATTPSWAATQGVGWILRLALADYDNDGFLDLAAASNGQLGDPNSIKVFRNRGGALDTVASFTMLRNRVYSSCVAWADVNGDGYVDLAAGGWWEPAVVFENHSGVLDTAPTWSWYPAPPESLVCEALVWTDVANSHLLNTSETFSGDGQRRLFTLGRRPVHSLDSVVVDDARLPCSAYCHDLLAGWFSLAFVPGSGSDNVQAFYRYSTHSDLAVTNWENGSPNYLFKNTTPGGISAEPCSRCPASRTLSALPNPFKTAVSLRLAARGPAEVRVCDATGRCIRILSVSSRPMAAGSVIWDGTDAAGRPVPPGVYLAAAEPGNSHVKLIRTR